jgi:SAM-dependent methyltransferase
VDKKDYSDFLKQISRLTARPSLFEPGEPHFWDDPHISRSMLEAHLDPTHEAASRKHKTIDEQVKHLLSSGVLKPGDRLLDLGCGPGLYASRLAARGVRVTGIDISKRSLKYAIAQARKQKLDIEYRLQNFLDIDYSGEYDAVMQIYGELNVFSDIKLNDLLRKLHRALVPGGLLIFDVTTRVLRLRAGLKNGWYFSNRGFWRSGRHLVLEQGFDYPGENVWLDRYIVIDNDGIKMYHNWFHDYDLKTVRQVLKKAGFTIKHAWNDLAGRPYKAGGDWITIVAGKR